MNCGLKSVVAILIRYEHEREHGREEYTGHLPAAAVCGSLLPLDARVVEWQTRTFEGRMPKGLRVQVPPRAQSPATHGIARRGQLELFVSFPFR
jgi:hypothetical protein